MRVLMLSVILLPVLAGVLIPVVKSPDRKLRQGLLLAVLIIEALMVTVLLFRDTPEVRLFSMTEKLTVSVNADPVSRVFMAIAAYGYLLAGIFAFKYLDRSEEEGSFPEGTFWRFFLLSQGALMGMDLSANLISMYFFFEMITLLSMPMVLYERTQESVSAALRYLFYSIAGAFLALLAIFFLYRYSVTLDFAKGGNLDPAKVAGHETLLRVVFFLGFLGFGAKAGLYPLHGWLPAAHPVAPAPASAVLSGVIAKAGVLAIVRLLYFSIGTSFLSGSWVQTALLSVSLLTVFMGSMMAYREKVLKKRLAYSTVSQISYALFGLFLMNADGITGGFMQVLFHAAAKCCLFLSAGSIIYLTGFHNVTELTGIGKRLPKTMLAFTFAGLSLIGIPPFAGFVSKWYLAAGSLDSGISFLSWFGPVILLVSALLTAGYLLPITVDGFFPGLGKKAHGGTDAEGTGEGSSAHDGGENAHAAAPKVRVSISEEGGLRMLVPLIVLAALTLLLGLGSGLLKDFFAGIAASML